MARSHGDEALATESGREPVGLDRAIDILSHELRSPITSIQIGTKVLRDRAGSIPRPIRAEVVEAVEEEAERLYRLVEDLLAVVRHDAGRGSLSVRPLLLQRWLPGVVAAEIDSSPSLRVHADVPADLPAVLADDGALTHVIRNLLANAVRHAPEGMPVEIVGCVSGDDTVSIDVLDRGPGIEAGDSERLFEPFFRARAAEARGTGAGLGLAAARRLIEAMGGSIAAGSRDGGDGAWFSIDLPVAPADDASEADDAPEGPEAAPTSRPGEATPAASRRGEATPAASRRGEATPASAMPALATSA